MGRHLHRRATATGGVEWALRATLANQVSRAMELLWLFAVVSVPLIFVPPDLIISEGLNAFADVPKVTLLRGVVGLMVMLWLLHWALEGGLTRRYTLRTALPRLRAWLRHEPTRWVVVAAAGLTGAVLLSALLSVSLRMSLWGRVPGQDGHAAYTEVSYFLLFLIIATHLRTRAQLGRLLGAIVLAGVAVGAYAILQRYGLDPFHLAGHEYTALGRSPPENVRAESTLGNPIFAGAFLVLTIPITLAAGLVLATRMRPWQRLMLWALLLAPQLLGILFTLSRGPWVGLGVALVTLLPLTWIAFQRRTFTRVALLFGAALSVAVAFLLLPTLFSSAAQDNDATGGQGVADRFATIYPEVVAADLSGRVDIWRGATRLTLERPWFEFETLSLPGLRPVIGYGPELFKSTFPLASPPSQANQPHSNAHNFLLQQAVETGFLGVVSFLGLLGAFFVVGGVQLFRRGRALSRVHTWLLVVLLATLAGRVVEQMVGIARVGDLTLFWTLLAIFVALPTVMGASPVQPHEEAASPKRERRVPRVARVPRLSPLQVAPRLAVVVVILVLVGSVTWVKNVNYAWAATTVASAKTHFLEGDVSQSRELLDKAIALAPDVAFYHNLRAGIFDGYREGSETLTDQQRYAEEAYISNRDAFQANSLSQQTRLSLANSALQLAMLGYGGKDTEAIELYKQLASIRPDFYWPYHNALAAAYLDLGQPEEALKPLERSLDITRDSRESAQALYLQGVAYRELGQPHRAIPSLEASLRANDNGAEAREAHRHLAELYAALGGRSQASIPSG